MLTSRLLPAVLASTVFLFTVFANDPGFCNSQPVCTPCNCNAAGRCSGFCHTDKGSTTKHCDQQALGCKCPPGLKLHRRGGCFSGNPRIGVDPPGACFQVSSIPLTT
ncbi:hypothetical protein CTRI78_v008984 [Colletotrichum trifolii]|uniref:Secreted protein n=1 Tax=Colletotrichum trifolii TaxID=5466 RepID=A0A4V3HU05_COLTR|nr:hypothetical protein CTRI78_v008984 [Colletotrichum trifolii]